MEGVCPHLVEKLSKVLISSRNRAEPKHTIFNGNLVVVLQRVKPESIHVIKAVEVDWLEFIMEDPYHFLRGEAREPEDDAHDFKGGPHR